MMISYLRDVPAMCQRSMHQPQFLRKLPFLIRQISPLFNLLLRNIKRACIVSNLNIFSDCLYPMKCFVIINFVLLLFIVIVTVYYCCYLLLLLLFIITVTTIIIIIILSNQHYLFLLFSLLFIIIVIKDTAPNMAWDSTKSLVIFYVFILFVLCIYIIYFMYLYCSFIDQSTTNQKLNKQIQNGS